MRPSCRLGRIHKDLYVGGRGESYLRKQFEQAWSMSMLHVAPTKLRKGVRVVRNDEDTDWQGLVADVVGHVTSFVGDEDGPPPKRAKGEAAAPSCGAVGGAARRAADDIRGDAAAALGREHGPTDRRAALRTLTCARTHGALGSGLRAHVPHKGATLTLAPRGRANGPTPRWDDVPEEKLPTRGAATGLVERWNQGASLP